ncbi:MAG TPA: rhodanese-like domain-containing protein [Candidatus Obscuribacterales bacterium]
MTSELPLPELSVRQLKQKLDAGKEPVVLDVREAHELLIASLPRTKNTVHIPLGQLPIRFHELERHKEEEIVVYCRSGGRSQMAVNFLLQNGFRARNLKGGILAWSQEIDPQVPKY